MGDLIVLLFNPLKISVNLLLKFSLTLLFPVGVRQVIELNILGYVESPVRNMRATIPILESHPPAVYSTVLLT